MHFSYTVLGVEIDFHFYFTFKYYFPENRERERAEWEGERKKSCAREREEEREKERSRAVDLAVAPSITISPSRRKSRSREAPCRSRSQSTASKHRANHEAPHRADRLSLFLLLSIWPDLMIFFLWVLSVFLYWGMNDIVIFVWQPRNCEKMWPDLMIFFSGFCWCFSVLRNEWYNIFVWQPRKCEKMWATSRKCVFYGIFKNTTKHQKIFFETFFEMQPNTWKHFPFRKIAFPENGIFSGNTFTRTKRSLI